MQMPRLAFQGFSPIASIRSLIWPKQSTLPWGVTNHATCPRDFINRLPPDLLSKILLHLLFCVKQEDADLADSPFVTWRMRVSPFPLSHVCRYWMKVVNSTKEMWSSIVIWKPSEHQLYRVEQWMNRVDSYPLQWCMGQSEDPDEEEEEATVRILELLARRSKNWREIRLSLSGERLPQQLLTHLGALRDDASSSQLQRVFVTLELRRDDSPVLPTFLLWNLLGSLPSLFYLCWDTPFTPGSPFSRNLTVLRLYSPISIEDFLERILHCRRLEVLCIHRLCQPNSITFLPEHMAMDVDPPPRRIMPVLRRLVITSELPLRPIFNAVEAPELRVLILESRQPVEIIYFREFLSASQCDLKTFSLHVRDIRLNPDEVIPWLRLQELQSLTTLCLLNMEFTDYTLRLLHRPGQGGLTLFPKLLNLTLGTCNQDVDVGILLRMLGSRFWTTSLITPLTVETEELLTANISVRHLPVELSKYAEMIDTCGQRMKDRPIQCCFTVE